MREKRFALKPIYLYAIMAAFIIAFTATAFVGSNLTGFASAGSSDEIIVTSPFGSVEIQTLPTEPSCADNCGKPCWLVASGQPAGTLESSQGSIGISGCDNNCYDLQESISQLLCCSHSDCPASAPVCSAGGECIAQNNSG